MINASTSLKYVAGLVILLALSACGKVDDPAADLKDIKLEDWPLTDCFTSSSSRERARMAFSSRPLSGYFSSLLTASIHSVVSDSVDIMVCFS